MEELSPMENLLIEHPSIFIKFPSPTFEKKSVPVPEKDEDSVKVVIHQKIQLKKWALASGNEYDMTDWIFRGILVSFFFKTIWFKSNSSIL